MSQASSSSKWNLSGQPHRVKDGIDVSEERAETLKASRRTVLAALRQEEAHAFIGSNYFELEETLVSLALRDSSASGRSMESRWKNIFLVGRRLANLLSSCRFYLDHTHRALAHLCRNDSSAQSDFKQRCSAAFDSRFSYRLIDRLRNYAQHRDVPVCSLLFDHWWIDPEDRSKGYERAVDYFVSV